MKNKFYLLAICFLLSSKFSFASHAMGSELTYRCLGPGSIPGSMQYELTFIFYQDCVSFTNPPVPMNIDITNTCGLANPASVFLPLFDTIEIKVTCPSEISTCDGGNYSGIRQWIFRGNVILPGPCSNWTLSHTESVRNAAITTINNPQNYTLYVFTTINNSGGLCNNSPTFSNPPVLTTCVGQQFCYNHGAYDSDGDSLTFQIITPRYGPNPSDTVDYATGYSATNPVQWTIQPMFFIPSNGDFCIWPSQADVTVMAILVNEWRNGVLIGQVERDMQLNLVTCNNNLPVTTGFNALPSYNANACVNQQNCFFIKSMDVDLSDSTTITWDQSIQGVTFTSHGGRRDSAVFCWSPSLSDTSFSPRCFTVTVKDDHCPYFGTQSRTYCITVDASPSCHSVGFDKIQSNQIQIRVFPQPAIDIIHFDFGNDFIPDHKKKLFISDLVGQTIFQSTINENLMRINVSELSSKGMLFAYVVDESGRVIERVKLITLD